jgi:hypothetical protein
MVAEVAKATRNHGVAGVTVGSLARSCAEGLKYGTAQKHGGKVRSHCRGVPLDGRAAFRELKARAATN